MPVPKESGVNTLLTDEVLCHLRSENRVPRPAGPPDLLLDPSTNAPTTVEVTRDGAGTRKGWKRSEDPGSAKETDEQRSGAGRGRGAWPSRAGAAARSGPGRAGLSHPAPCFPREGGAVPPDPRPPSLPPAQRWSRLPALPRLFHGEGCSGPRALASSPRLPKTHCPVTQ